MLRTKRRQKWIKRLAPKAMLLLLGVLFLPACGGEDPMPLPIGYFRIDLPEPDYHWKEPLQCPFAFKASREARLEYFARGKESDECWFDLYYPALKARVHFTYKELNGQLREYSEESRAMAYEHSIKAGKIQNIRVERPEDRVYGMVYRLEGNVASQQQFFLTDSSNHFLRGSLYFEARPNQDSIAPVLGYVRRDLDAFVSSFVWR